jgi:hypothetical protein
MAYQVIFPLRSPVIAALNVQRVAPLPHAGAVRDPLSPSPSPSRGEGSSPVSPDPPPQQRRTISLQRQLMPRSVATICLMFLAARISADATDSSNYLRSAR